MRRRPPYFRSLVAHVFFAVLLLTIDLHSVSAKKDAALRSAARAHEAIYQQSSSATYAERLKRIRDVIEHLDADTKKDAPQTPPPPGEPEKAPAAAKVPPPPQPASTAPVDMQQLWQESRREYDLVREAYIEQKAKRLSDLAQIDLGKAREQVRADIERKESANGGQGAENPSETAASIAGMHGNAQRMLSEMLRSAKGGGGGVPLDLETAREAYRLSETQVGGSASGQSGEAVDWTPFMLSRVPRVNSILDTPEDQKRVAVLRNMELRNRFNHTGREVRFTRRLGGADAVAGAWATPDAWYVIGPFPNNRRENIETPFPPEIEIDRDAVYEGRNGRVVSWQYIRPTQLNVRPPDMYDFAVYYAYTEVVSTTPKDCWLAIGSDDYSKVWLNGFLVWHGSKNEKMWHPTEGFCRVHLDAGVNRFLVRLENGINGCEFSVLIALE